MKKVTICVIINIYVYILYKIGDKNMLSSKYSNVLTMLLVVFIVAIIGVMGYFGD